MGSHSATCHPSEVIFPPLPQAIKTGTRFSDPKGMQGWVDLVGLVTYQGGIPAQRRSPIPALTGLNVEQLRSCYERRYHRAKPPTTYVSAVWKKKMKKLEDRWLEQGICGLLSNVRLSAIAFTCNHAGMQGWVDPVTCLYRNCRSYLLTYSYVLFIGRR